VIPSGRARIAGVIGWPVAHSRSPRLHGYWLERHGIDGAYVPFAVPPERLEQALRALPALGIAGVNVTVPHKEAALRIVEASDPLARRIGAVNTVVVREGGALEGWNTDAHGFLAHLRASVADWRPGDGPALVLGAGGAARAVCAALADAGVPEVRVANRTAARASTLARALGGIVAVPWAERASALADAALIVNATTLGMTGRPALELDLARAGSRAIVYDLVYAPLETGLLAAARGRGLRAVDGLGMLLHQARPGFAAWFGVEPEVTPELRAFVAADLAP
jgi:shikimate dehydrogenase